MTGDRETDDVSAGDTPDVSAGDTPDVSAGDTPDVSAGDTRSEETGLVRVLHRLVPFALTLVFAGLGHLYIRYLRRGLVWMGVYVFTLLFLSTLSPVLEDDLPAFPGAESLPGGIEPMGFVFPAAVLVLCLVDLYIFQRVRQSSA